MMRDHHDPLQPHVHDPNPEPPTSDPMFVLQAPDGTEKQVTVEDLQSLPQTTVTDCYIVSTGHGTSGPFAFTGVRLRDLVQHYLPAGQAWAQVEVISADGFGTRVRSDELTDTDSTRPIILALAIDGTPLTRKQGLVRLIVPSETDDALRQVKWVARVNVRLPQTRS